MKTVTKKKVETPRSFNSCLVANRLHEALCIDLGFDSQSLLPQEYDKDDSRSLYRDVQCQGFLKKFRDPNLKSKLLDIPTYQKFLDIRDHLLDIRRDLFLPDVTDRFYGRIRMSDSARDRTLKRAHFLWSNAFRDFSIDEWFLACKHSSGSSQGVPFVDTTMEAKWTFPLTITEDAIPVMDAYFAYDKELYAAVLEFNAVKISQGICQYAIVTGSKATTVPKTDKINRMIGIEATCNMFLQQGLMVWLVDKISLCFGLDFRNSQNKHKELALLYSITRTGATIDFTSASDCTLLDYVKWLCSSTPLLFASLDAIRSKVITLPVSRDVLTLEDTVFDLPMISTMGNATTFPLETLVFVTIALASLSHKEHDNLSLLPNWEDLTKVSVFGDDCIVPVDIADHFIEVCTSIGYLVNKEKTFTGDYGFRESCGGDYFYYHDVRPIFLGTPVSNRRSALAPWLYSLINNIIKKYISYFGCRDWVYGKKLFQTIGEIFLEYKINVTLVPENYPDDSGIRMGDDSVRFILNNFNGCRFSEISADTHGTVSLRYNKFVYNLHMQGYAYWASINGEKVKMTNRMKKDWKLSFKYLQELLTSDDLRYATKKKYFCRGAVPFQRAIMTCELLKELWSEKQDGGYVVARGTSFVGYHKYKQLGTVLV